MDYRQIIFIAAIIAITFGNSNREDVDEDVDVNRKRKAVDETVDEAVKECKRQLRNEGGFEMDESSTKAFKHAYETLSIPKDSVVTDSGKGILYEYHKHLYEAGIKFLGNVLNPMCWCYRRLQDHSESMVYKNMNVCKTNMHPTYFSKKEIRDVFDNVFNSCKYTNNRQNIECNGSFVNFWIHSYIIYLGSELSKYIENSSAIGPKEFCKLKTSTEPVKKTSEIRETEHGNTLNSENNEVEGTLFNDDYTEDSAVIYTVLDTFITKK